MDIWEETQLSMVQDIAHIYQDIANIALQFNLYKKPTQVKSALCI